LITGAQTIGKGKPVVLAAYVDPIYEQNVRLMEATIFASGGGHIELGERKPGTGIGTPGMLADPYFPKYQPMSASLAQAILRDYDFSVRYQEVTGPQTQDVTQDFQDQITIDGVSADPKTDGNRVWPIVRQGDGFITINLVNLLGVDQTEWAKPVPKAPDLITNFQLCMSGIEGTAAQVWLANPDSDDISPHPVKFSQAAGNLTIDIPSLAYWDMVVIEWK
jgi:dextranase